MPGLFGAVASKSASVAQAAKASAAAVEPPNSDFASLLSAEETAMESPEHALVEEKSEATVDSALVADTQLIDALPTAAAPLAALPGVPEDARPMLLAWLDSAMQWRDSATPDGQANALDEAGAERAMPPSLRAQRNAAMPMAFGALAPNRLPATAAVVVASNKRPPSASDLGNRPMTGLLDELTGDLAVLSPDGEFDGPSLAAASTPAVFAKVAQGLPDVAAPSSTAGSSDLRLSTDKLVTAVTLPLPERTKAGASEPLTMAVGALRNEISAWQTSAIGSTTAAPATASVSPIQADALMPQQNDFVDKLATQMQWMGQQKIQRAELELHPAELGRLDITLELEGQSLRAEFGSSHAEVRAAIESQLPRLRDLLAAQGFQLGDAQVGSQQRESRSTFAPMAASVDVSVSDAPASEPQPVPVRRVSAGRLDEFA